MSAFFITISVMIIFRYIPVILLFLLILQNAQAKPTLRVSPGIIDFHYEEFDTDTSPFNPTTLDKESGIIPGISFALIDRQFTLGTDIFNGNVYYDGQTQTGIPHTTRTDESLYNLYFRYDFLNNFSKDSFHHNYFISLNYHLWKRDIKANNGVSGLYEKYRWGELEFGINMSEEYSANKIINFELAGFKTFNGNIVVDLTAFDFPIPQLNLGDKFGIRSLVSLETNINSSLKAGIGVEYKYWGFGKSNIETISNGVLSGPIFEPESKSNLLRFFVQFTQSF